ncbi:hypothetical protein [Bacillus sp. GB_SG_008]|uniref:hypothetical protein n=1 Tax=Bacillus sp. GB_SG_008 TaxID=3454627 RepID=UPI003F837AA6
MIEHVTGNYRWAIILCRFSDQSQLPQTTQFFKDLFVNPGTGGMFDYWHDVSYGTIDLTGSKVYDNGGAWYQLPYTLAFDKSRTGPQPVQRWNRINDAINAVRDSIVSEENNPNALLNYNGIIIILNAQVDSGSIIGPQMPSVPVGTHRGVKFGLVVLDPGAWTNSWASHEMGHGYGLNHSYNIDTGVYGDGWDIMSAFTFGGASATFNDRRFGTSGPGLNAPGHVFLGWNGNEYASVNLNTINPGEFKRIILAPLNQSVPSGANSFALVSTGDTTYTVEYRNSLGWDQAITKAVLIHQIRNDDTGLLLKGTHGKEALKAGDEFSGPGFIVSVDTIKEELATVLIGKPRQVPPPPVGREKFCKTLKTEIGIDKDNLGKLGRKLQNATTEEEKKEIQNQIEELYGEYTLLIDEFNDKCRGSGHGPHPQPIPLNDFINSNTGDY